jgi:hypothetical protein
MAIVANPRQYKIPDWFLNRCAAFHAAGAGWRCSRAAALHAHPAALRAPHA